MQITVAAMKQEAKACVEGNPLHYLNAVHEAALEVNHPISRNPSVFELILLIDAMQIRGLAPMPAAAASAAAPSKKPDHPLRVRRPTVKLRAGDHAT